MTSASGRQPGRRPFRFGVLSKGGASRRAWLDLARRVEALGFSTLLVPEHSRPQLSPLPALVAAASVTGLRVGTLVLNVDFHHPVWLARDAATVDLLTDGRFELGVGAGWMRRDYTESGVRWDRGAQRAERLAEAVELVRRLHDGTPVTFAGETYRTEDLTGGPGPVQRPLPILIGAGGPRMLAIAARLADIVGMARSAAAGPTERDAARDATAGATAAKVALLRQLAGDRYEDLELNVLVIVAEVGAGAQATAERMADATGLTTREVVETPQHLIGSERDAVDQLLARREELDISYVVVRDIDVDRLAGVVGELSGR